MAARAITIRDRNWWKQERTPAKPSDHAIIVSPNVIEALRGAPRILNVQQVGELLSFSAWTVREWVKIYERTQGKRGLKCQRVSGRIRILRDDLAEFLALENARSK